MSSDALREKCFDEYVKLTGDRCQARHFYLAKQFCFLDADCLVVEESQDSSRRSVGKYPVKPLRLEGDSFLAHLSRQAHKVSL